MEQVTMQDMAALKGKRIIVTGGASGMGAAVVQAYARAGARLVSFTRNDPGTSVLTALSEEERSRITIIHCDVSNPSMVEATVAEAMGLLDGLDGLVNCAGIAPGAPAEQITPEAWDEVFAINVRGTFLTNKAAFPHLKDRGGFILNFASSTGVTGLAGKAHYAASKGAVLAWTRTVAREWGSYGIRVNAIAPVIWTPMYEKTRSLMTPEKRAAHDADMAKLVAIGGRAGDPERDFAPYMIFLAGEGARFITGQTIKIDGGLLML
jgi:NAD(P)-dependent dehydrogenase (short-subunit alcohol dehydrogenase family)